MSEIIKTKAQELLQNQDINLIIGYEKSFSPLSSTPVFIRKAKDCPRLTFDPTCVSNLAGYVLKNKGKKTAVFLKPCDVKALVVLIQEKQLKQDDIHIIGLNCAGVIDEKKLAKQYKNIREIDFKGDKIILKTSDSEKELKLEDFLADKCKPCTERSPKIYHTLLGEKPKEVKFQELKEVEDFEKLNSKEKEAFWDKHFARCMRCYACIKVCPLCYCERCFVEKNQPQWLDKTTDPTANKIFHLTRAFHLAGRCIDCGECERICPMNIPLMLLNRKMAKEVLQHFDYKAGEDLEGTPPLSTFKQDDKEDFIR